VEVVIDHYSGKGASAKIVKLLKEHHVPVRLSRGGPLLHYKFMYIDGKVLVNGSANWTKAAFTQNDDCFVVLHALTAGQRECMESLWQIIWSEGS
jgi:cardiolipin synthase